MKGNIHSIESFGTVDGPGIRYVIFMRGCPMRCVYCHNPDTWGTKENTIYTSEQLLQKYEGVKNFCKGGITLTGGEPLLQIDFVIDLFRKCKEKNIHTCLDTSGILFNNDNKYEELVKYTDLVMLDIKHINEEKHKEITRGFSNKNVLNFAEYLSERNVTIWIRHVLVKGYNEEKHLKELGKFISKINVTGLDILPYHTMGIKKYKELNIPYTLSVQPTTKEEVQKAKEIILEGVKEGKRDESFS